MKASRCCAILLITGSLVGPWSGATESTSSREHALKTRYDAAVGRLRSNAVVGKFFAASALLPSGNCALEDPTGDLRQRAAWNSGAATCAQAMGSALRVAAQSTSGPDAAEYSLASVELEQLAIDFRTQGAQREGEEKFLGYNWGIGFGASYSFDDVIDDATIVNGVVQANKEQTLLPRAVLEFHRFFAQRKKITDGVTITRGHGPFAAVTATSDDLLAGFGLGWMVGWKDDQKPGDSSAFTIGLGIMLDGNVKSLADGIEDGAPLPPGEPEIRFEEKSRAAALLLVTRSF